MGLKVGTNVGPFVGFKEKAMDGEIDGITEGAIDDASLESAARAVGCAVTIAPHKKRENNKNIYSNASLIFIFKNIFLLQIY